MNRPHVEVKRESFTLREIEVLGLIAGGLTNQEISQKLHVSTETVKWYAKQIYPKLGVSNRTQAALRADEVGLLNFGKDPFKEERKTRKLSNLPAQLTSYIGRKKESNEIKELIRENRLLTLTGPGGIGKTRLALQVASELHDDNRDGVWLVELAQITDPAQVVSAIANVLVVSERGAISLDRLLKNYLSSKNLLLLIDNFEHLLSAASFVGELLAKAPHVTILTTSREKLHIYGEVEYTVSHLNLPDIQRNEKTARLRSYDSISLFIERAQAANPGYEIGDDQIQSVARICRLLAGLPLAIELSAPLVKLFPPSTIAEKLESSLDSLPEGPRDFPARQRTLRATLEWSYNLLNEDEKILFTNLAVFNIGGTLEAIEYVNGVQKSGNFISILTSLVNRNLLIPNEGRDGEMYFEMFETTRQLNKEHLASTKNANTIYKQHAEYYLYLAECAMTEYSSPKNKYWFVRIQIEQDNLRSAFQWFKENNEIQKCMRLTIALKNYWRNYGYQKEGMRWAETTLGGEGQTPQALRAEVLLAAAEYCLDLYPDDRAEDFLAEALEIFQQLEDKLNIAWCNAIMSIAMVGSKQEITRSIKKAQECLDTFRTLDDKSGMTFTNSLLGELARLAGDFDMAERYYKQSLELAKETGEILREGTQYANLGILAYQKGEYQHAEILTKQGLRIFLEMDAYYGVFYDIGGLAGAALGLGKPKRAAKLLGASSAGLDSLEASHQQVDKLVIQHIVDETKKSLDGKAFMEAWQEGQRMTVQEAFDYALEE